MVDEDVEARFAIATTDRTVDRQIIHVDVRQVLLLHLGVRASVCVCACVWGRGGGRKRRTSEHASVSVDTDDVGRYERCEGRHFTIRRD